VAFTTGQLECSVEELGMCPRVVIIATLVSESVREQHLVNAHKTTKELVKANRTVTSVEKL
jgi:hypothetical protein